MKKSWWHDKAAYQIWPKSFYDSNGDGIGDIPGVIEKLDILKELGIDIVWLSPVYPSPLADEGYDISDYYGIDPRFGTLEDLDRLVREAKSRGISILMDLVVNHCSDEHIWFKKACEDPEGPYGKFFYLKKLAPGEKLPCNWRSYFGGPVWEKLPGHDDYVYLHVFHKKQPDLNWENPELRREVYRMMNWWFERGIAGFRIDAIINIKKVLPFQDYPADGEDGLCSILNMLEKADGVLEFLDEMARETFHKYDTFSIAELFDNKPEDLPRFIGENGCFSCIFDFGAEMIGRNPSHWPWRDKPLPDQWRDAVFAGQNLSNHIGFMANIIENHDQPRGASRYLADGERTERAKKMLGGLSVLLRGLPFLYQGQEIGMENTSVSDISEVDDCSAIGIYKQALDAGVSPSEAIAAINGYSRDNARTPYQWDDGENAGFSSAAPWLPVNKNYREINLKEQLSRPDSLWHFYRQLIALRKEPEWKETFVYGETQPCLTEEKNLMAYLRKGEKTVLVIGNWQTESRKVKVPFSLGECLLTNIPEAGAWYDAESGTVSLEGYQILVVRVPA